MAAFDRWLDRVATDAIDRLRLELATEVGWSGPSLPVTIIPTESAVIRDQTSAVEILLGLIAATGRDALRKIVRDQIADRMGDEPGLTSEERATALADARADLLSAELAEEGMIRQMEAVGLIVARRSDVPGLVLMAADAELAK